MLKKIVKAYSLDRDVAKWVNKQRRKHISASHVVNEILKGVMNVKRRP